MKTRDEIKEKNRKSCKNDYWKFHDMRLAAIKERQKKIRIFIIQQLGARCCICGITKPLCIHHLEYQNHASGASANTLKALKAGKLTLVCRKHHRAIHYVNELKRAGKLEKVLELLNEKRRAEL